MLSVAFQTGLIPAANRVEIILKNKEGKKEIKIINVCIYIYIVTYTSSDARLGHIISVDS